MTKPMFEQIAANLAAADAEQLASMIAMMEEVTLSGALWDRVRESASRTASSVSTVQPPEKVARPFRHLRDQVSSAGKQMKSHPTIERMAEKIETAAAEGWHRVRDGAIGAIEGAGVAERVQARAQQLSTEHPAALRVVLVQRVSEALAIDTHDKPLTPTDNWYRQVFAQLAKDLKLDPDEYSDEQLVWAVLPQVFERVKEQAKTVLEDVGEEDRSDIAAKTYADLLRAQPSLSDEQVAHLLVAIGADELTEEAVRSAFGTGAILTGTYAAAATAGFGLFVATSTAIHAVFTGLLGVTVPFVAYTTASSVLAFLINPVVGIALGLVMVGVMGRRKQDDLKGQLVGAVMLFLALSGGPLPDQGDSRSSDA